MFLQAVSGPCGPYEEARMMFKIVRDLMELKVGLAMNIDEPDFSNSGFDSMKQVFLSAE